MKTATNYKIEEHSLSRQEASHALENIMCGNTSPVDIELFIREYLHRQITYMELSGFRDYLLNQCKRIDLSDYDPTDLCGTGGDEKSTFNISTAAAFIAAGAGVPIAKHGNSAVSSRCGSSDLLEYFGYQFSSSEDILKQQLETCGICFLHAPLFHPALKSVSKIRKEIKEKTFFNMLGPLIHPAFVTKQVSGVYSKELADLYKSIMKNDDKQFAIIYSVDGYDEISLTSDFRVITNEDDRILSPEDAGMKRVLPSALHGGLTIDESAKMFCNILSGEGTTEQQNVVIVNAAIAIHINYPESCLEVAVDMAKHSLLSGKAFTTFKKLIALK